MKITNQKFAVEQFESGQQGWIGALLSPLNVMIDQLVAGLANNVTISDNLYQELKVVSFVNDPTNFPLKFSTKFSAAPVGISVVFCQDTTGGMPATQPSLVWSYSKQQVTVTSVSGLTSGLTYKLRAWVIYG